MPKLGFGLGNPEEILLDGQGMHMMRRMLRHMLRRREATETMQRG